MADSYLPRLTAALILGFAVFQFLHWLAPTDAQYMGEWLDVVIADTTNYLYLAFTMAVLRLYIPPTDKFSLWTRRALLALVAGLCIQGVLRWTPISGRGFADILLTSGVYLIGAAYALIHEAVRRDRKGMKGKYKQHSIGPKATRKGFK